MMSLAWPLFRVTEQAALAAWPQTGCGDKNKIDGLAVTAMRQALNDVVDSIGQRNSYVKTWGCGGFLNETNIYSRGKSLCF